MRGVMFTKCHWERVYELQFTGTGNYDLVKV